jgi:hypothetical protein
MPKGGLFHSNGQQYTNFQASVALLLDFALHMLVDSQPKFQYMSVPYLEYPKTQPINNQSTLRNITEERRPMSCSDRQS